ncbi:MAG TPA: DNA repair protein RecN [Bdellovibrionota bacterium]|nr:DNA repair protein RecN [Bdellovibrionota bacterium]
MIRQIRVANFAIVEDGTIVLDAGMTCFTGETGAGKTLLLEAIGLLLGAKASSELVREGAEFAEVEGLFELGDQPQRLASLEAMGFDAEDGGADLVIRREIAGSNTKKNRIWIQGKIATRKQLHEILGDWIEVSGQHEFLKLANADYLLGTLDQFAGLRDEAARFAQGYHNYSATRSELKRLIALKSEQDTKLDFFRFQVEELNRAGISDELPNQEAELIEMRNRLGSVEKIRETTGKGILLLEGDESAPGALPQTQALVRELRGLDKFGAEFSDLLKLAEESETSLRELTREVGRLAVSVEADPEALEAAEEKLSQLSRLKRKHQRDTRGLVELRQDLMAQLRDLESSDERIGVIERALASQQKNLEQLSAKLFLRRRESAKTFAQKWQQGVQELGITHAILEFQVLRDEDFNEKGGMSVNVLFSANPGTKPLPLAKIASGGELSRLLLSLKHIVASKSEVGVYLFDEVDTGIGGKTAQVVGERLRLIASSNQVLVVSHLAQIAAHAHHHFSIEKSLHRGKMQTQIRKLASKERTLELARMLGDPESNSAQKLAREMISSATQ